MIVQTGLSLLRRNKLSTLATGLVGASQLRFGVTFSCFNSHSFNKKKHEKIKKLALAFQTEIAHRFTLGGDITFEVSISSRNIYDSILNVIYL